MNEMARGVSTSSAPVRRIRLGTGASGLVGVMIMVVALVATSVIAVVFAATLAVIMVLASVLLFLAMLALRVWPRPQALRASSSRRAGHAWVSYSLERSPR